MTTDAPTAPRTVYTGRTTAWPMVIGTSLGAVPLILLGATGDGGWSALALPLLLVLIGIVANVLTCSSVRASAGPNGFDLRWGIVGWPHCSYALDEIERAEVIDLPWYRVTYSFWWTHRGTSCTIRSGPTVRLHLTNGRIVTVTVPEPQLAVAAIEDAKRR
ncbi:MAG: hypothetical protein ACTHN0_11220 [Aquihabitans sp.]